MHRLGPRHTSLRPRQWCDAAGSSSAAIARRWSDAHPPLTYPSPPTKFRGVVPQAPTKDERRPISEQELRITADGIRNDRSISKSAKRDKLRRLFHRYETTPIPGQSPPPPPPGVERAVCNPVTRMTWTGRAHPMNAGMSDADKREIERRYLVAADPPPAVDATADGDAQESTTTAAPTTPSTPNYRMLFDSTGEVPNLPKQPKRNIDPWTARSDVLSMEGLSRSAKRHKLKKLMRRTAPPPPKPPEPAYYSKLSP